MLCLASLHAGIPWKGLADSICTILRGAIAGWVLEQCQEFFSSSPASCLFPEAWVPRGCGKHCRACYWRMWPLQWFRRGCWLTAHVSKAGVDDTKLYLNLLQLSCSGWNIFLRWRRGLIDYSLFLNLDTLEQGVERKGETGQEWLLSTRVDKMMVLGWILPS